MKPYAGKPVLTPRRRALQPSERTVANWESEMHRAELKAHREAAAAIVPVRTWGNSLAIRIPAAIAKQLHFDNGTRVFIALSDDGSFSVRKARQRYKLSDLLDKLQENAHEPP